MKKKLITARNTFIKWLLAVVPAVLILSSIFSSSSVSATNGIEVDHTPEKIAALKHDLVQRLSDCERAGHSEADGLIVFDSNAKASVGVLQFQVKTVISTTKAVYGTQITGKEAVELALDKERAFKLAEDIIFNNVQGGIDNWHNCNVKHGLAAEVVLIKKFEVK